MTKKLIIAAPIALAASLMVAAPANAASWNNGKQIRVELRQLDNRIDNLRGISKYQANRFERRVDNLQYLQRQYSRNGYSKLELRKLNRSIASLKADIRNQSRTKKSPSRFKKANSRR